jgi:hypothetical protein
MRRYSIAVASLLCLSAVVPAGLAQSPGMDPADKNYKLTMDKVKAYDTAMGKMRVMFASDAALQNEVREAMKKGSMKGMIDVMEHSPKTQPIFKASGLTPHEFLLIPTCLQITANVYNEKAQATALGQVVTKENLAFYEKNKAELDQIMKSWKQGGRGGGNR